MNKSAYGLSVTLPVPFDTAVADTTAALKAEGFGVLTSIDVQQTLKTKLNRDFRKYVILGACNPGLAYRGLQDELALGLLLPCNVCVWEDDEGATVAVLRPDKMVEFAANPKLGPMAREADEKLRRALGRLTT